MEGEEKEEEEGIQVLQRDVCLFSAISDLLTFEMQLVLTCFLQTSFFLVHVLTTEIGSSSKHSMAPFPDLFTLCFWKYRSFFCTHETPCNSVSPPECLTALSLSLSLSESQLP